jgi:signal transduction histidine kinase
MTMFSLWERVSNIGITNDLPQDKIKSIQLLNQLAFPVWVLQTIVCIQNIIRHEYLQFGMGIFIITTTAAILFFNHLKKYFCARIILNLFYPIVIFILQMTYGTAFRVQFAYIVIMLTSVIFHREKWVRYVLISWSMLLYFLGEYYTSVYPPLFSLSFTPFDMHIVFICSVLCIYLISEMYVSENEKKEEYLTQTLTSLNIKVEELNLANKELERFAYIASHDLKTPIRTIVSYLDLIDKKIKSGDHKDIERYIAFAKSGGIQMNKLVTEILEYSKLNITEDVETEDVDLNVLVNENMNQLRTIIEDKNAMITTVNLPTIKTNRLLIGLIFQNLIENGLKYNTSAQPKIVIESNVVKEGIELTFSDNGIGIEKDYHESVFQMFTRLHNDHQIAGTGMGLAICKKIIERLHGKITLQSEVGLGTSFVIYFPM